MKGLIIFLIVFAIAMIAVFTSVHNKTIEERREAYNLDKERKAALVSFEKATKTLTSIHDVADQAADIPLQATNIAQTILGTPHKGTITRSTSQPPPATPTSLSTVKSTPSPTPLTTPPHTVDEARPFGQPTREELDARRARREPRNTPEQTQAQPPPTTPPSASPTATATATPTFSLATPPGQTSPIAVQARSVLGTVNDHVNRLAALLVSVDETANTTEQLYANIMKPITAYDAAPLRKKLAEQQGVADNLHADATNILAELKKTLIRMDDLKKQHEAALLAQQNEQERLAREAALKTQIAQERNAARELEKQQAGLVKQLKFNEAVDSINTGMAACKTDEGKEAFRLAAERFSALQTLKDFLIQSITTAPFRWGWMQNSTNGKDITGADQNALTITGGSVPWPDVQPPQLKRIIQNYIAATQIKLSQRAELHLAAALFWKIVGEEATSTALSAKARELNPDIAGKIDRLLNSDWPH